MNNELFKNESLDNEEKYIEKFQEQLFREDRPSQGLLSSLKKQNPHTLKDLRNRLLQVQERGPSSNKYSVAIQAVDEVLGGQNP